MTVGTRPQSLCLQHRPRTLQVRGSDGRSRGRGCALPQPLQGVPGRLSFTQAARGSWGTGGAQGAGGHHDATALARPSGCRSAGLWRPQADCTEGQGLWLHRDWQARGSPGARSTRSSTHTHHAHEEPSATAHTGEKGNGTLRAEAAGRFMARSPRTEGPGVSVGPAPLLCRPPRAPRHHQARVCAHPRCRRPCPGRPCSAASAAVSPCTSG